MGETCDKLISLLDYVYEYEKLYLATLTDEERAAQGAADDWSPKDVLAHVSHWDIHSAKELVDPANYEPPVYDDDFNITNEQFWQKLKDLSWAEIEAMVEQAHDDLTGGLHGLDDDQLTDPERYGWTNNRPLWQRVTFGNFYHPMTHLGQLFLQRGQIEEANAAQEKAAALQLELSDTDRWRGTVLYNLGCYYATSGQKELALKNVAAGLPLYDYLKELAPQDGDLEILHDDPEFLVLLAG
jgi:tetratricopeptide (TPR) repeat protein